MSKDDRKAKMVLEEKARKKFDFGNPADLEATSEYPVMYKALDTEPKTKHPFNLYRDISSEPDAVGKTLEITDEITTRIAGEIAKRGITQVINVGLPTSIFVGMVISASLVRHCAIQSWYVDSTEFMLGNIPYDPEKTAFFLYSGSGSTFDTNAAADMIKAKGAYSVAFTSIAGSPITQKCSESIVCAGGMDTGGSDTFHYATRIAAGYLLSFKLGKLLQPKAHDFDALLAELRAAPKVMATNFDAWDKRAWSIAQRFCKKRAMLVVGGGPNIGSAEEMALKFNEMASMPAQPMCPTRHLHGVFGLTDENIVTFIIAPPGSPHEKWLQQVAQVTTLLKSPAVAIVDAGEHVIADQVDYVVRVPTKNEYIFALLAVPIIQIIPYYFAVADGTINPDCQRSNIPKHARAWGAIFPPGSH
nr:SIS domain-containing protein [Candidatus Sigynarchaeum springense]